MPAETAQAICCMIFGGVLERYPRLKVCFAHGGKHLFYQADHVLPYHMLVHVHNIVTLVTGLFI